MVPEFVPERLTELRLRLCAATGVGSLAAQNVLSTYTISSPVASRGDMPAFGGPTGRG